MIRIDNITDEASQTLPIVFVRDEITITLKYADIVRTWLLSVRYRNWRADNVRMALGTRLLKLENRPFDFVVISEITGDLEPDTIDAFSSGNYSLIMLEPADLKTIRGFEVQI